MIVVLDATATPPDVTDVVTIIESGGGRASTSSGGGRTLVVATDAAGHVSTDLRTLAAVRDVVAISSSHKLVSREHQPVRSTVRVGTVAIGPDTVTLVAGPCAVESPDQMLDCALIAKAAGATLLRGGAYKPRSSPYAFQGLGESGLKVLASVGQETRLPVVTEIVDPRDLDVVCAHADMLQVGARNMQNFELLKAIGRTGMPVLLKRGMSATVEEWLLAAEYVAMSGNLDIVLCERGIRTFERSTRNTLDISAVPVIQQLSHLPVIVDPSHSGGRRDLVLPLTRAAIAAGADGVIVDVHTDPEAALCDGGQALTREDMGELRRSISELARVGGRDLAA
ncbi:3-deoxy-7-phosphoheptulonate synthase [Micromonospora matsumotoense]|uniref:3-deoxy-7-phosphoheptulonate synthase n=1 Tax=Micromonospora matsumotoense TaxID=121616 RepID=UPI0033C83176